MVGRNDPCPCGSGKKYKKCCLKKDEEARRVTAEAERAERGAAAVALLPPPPAPEPLSPYAGTNGALGEALEPAEDSAIELTPSEARWEEFEAEEDYEGQITIFLETLDQGAMDADNAFEMLNVIYENSAAHGERDRFDALVALLRERLPDVYAHDAHFYLDWLTTNALVAGRLDEVPALAEELADMAGAQLDTVNRVFDQLAYYGQLAVLAAATRRAWPLVRQGEYFDWAVSEFAERATTYAMLDYLERTAAPNTAELEALGADFGCTDVRPGRSAQYLAHVTGQTGRRWTLDDFDLTAHRQQKGEPELPADDGRTDLYHLTVEFLGYLRREEGVPYTKGELARDQIQRYILERHAGKLKAESGKGRARKTGGKMRSSEPVHLLCPDRGTLDRFLVGLLDLFSSQPYKAAAMFELIPAWLRFLETRELIDADQRGRTLHELDGMVADMILVWSRYSSEPALRLSAERWRENAGLV